MVGVCVGRLVSAPVSLLRHAAVEPLDAGTFSRLHSATRICSLSRRGTPVWVCPMGRPGPLGATCFLLSRTLPCLFRVQLCCPTRCPGERRVRAVAFLPARWPAARTTPCRRSLARDCRSAGFRPMRGPPGPDPILPPGVLLWDFFAVTIQLGKQQRKRETTQGYHDCCGDLLALDRGLAHRQSL